MFYESGITIAYSDVAPRASDIALIICETALRNIHRLLLEQIASWPNNNSKNEKEENFNEASNKLMECYAWYLEKLSFYNPNNNSNDCWLCNNNIQINSNKRNADNISGSREESDRQRKRQKVLEDDFDVHIRVSKEKNVGCVNSSINSSNNDVNFTLAASCVVSEQYQKEQLTDNEQWCNNKSNDDGDGDGNGDGDVNNEEREELLEKLYKENICESDKINRIVNELHQNNNENDKLCKDDGLCLLLELLIKAYECCGATVARQLAIEMIDLLSVNKWISDVIVKPDNISNNDHGNNLENLSISENLSNNQCIKERQSTEHDIFVASELELNITNSLTTLYNLFESDNIEHESIYAFGSLTCGFDVWVKVAWSCASFKHQCELAHQASTWCSQLWSWANQLELEELEDLSKNSMEKYRGEEANVRKHKYKLKEIVHSPANSTKPLFYCASKSKLTFEPLVVDVTFLKQQLRDVIEGVDSSAVKMLLVNPNRYTNLAVLQESILLYLSHVLCTSLPTSASLCLFIDLLINIRVYGKNSALHSDQEERYAVWGNFQTCTRPILDRVAYGLLVRAILWLVLRSVKHAQECVQTVMFIAHQLHSPVISALTHYCAALVFMMNGQPNEACNSLAIVLELCENSVLLSSVMTNLEDAGNETNNNMLNRSNSHVNEINRASTQTLRNNNNNNNNNNTNTNTNTNSVNADSIVGGNKDGSEYDADHVDAIWATNLQKEELQRIFACCCTTLSQLILFYPGAISPHTRTIVMATYLCVCNAHSTNTNSNHTSVDNKINQTNLMKELDQDEHITMENRAKFASVNLSVYERFAKQSHRNTIINESKNEYSNYEATSLRSESVAQTLQHLLHLSQITASGQRIFTTLSQPLLLISHYPACVEIIEHINNETIHMQSSLYGVACSPRHFNEGIILEMKEIIDSHVFTSNVQRQMMHQLLLNAMATHVAQYVVCTWHELLPSYEKHTSLNEIVKFCHAIKTCYGESAERWIGQHPFFMCVMYYIEACELEEQGYTKSAYEAICKLTTKLLRLLGFDATGKLGEIGADHETQLYLSPECLLLFTFVQLAHAALCILMDKQKKMAVIANTLALVCTSCEYVFGVLVSEYVNLMYLQSECNTTTLFSQLVTLSEKAHNIGFIPLANYIRRSLVELYIHHNEWERALEVLQVVYEKNKEPTRWYRIAKFHITCALLANECAIVDWLDKPYANNNNYSNNNHSNNNNNSNVREHKRLYDKIYGLLQIILGDLYYFADINVIGVQIGNEKEKEEEEEEEYEFSVRKEIVRSVASRQIQNVVKWNEMCCKLMNECGITFTIRELLSVHLAVEQLLQLMENNNTYHSPFTLLRNDNSNLLCTQTHLLLRTLRWRQEQKNVLDTLQVYFADKENCNEILSLGKAILSNDIFHILLTHNSM